MDQTADPIPDRGPQVAGVAIFLVITSVVSMGLRCYVRLGIVKAFGLDDWLMLAATVSGTRSDALCRTGTPR